jgi:hypothetical protein
MSPPKNPVPFCQPPYLTGPSPYYTESHRKWQKTCRTFVEQHLIPHAADWERMGSVPGKNNISLPLSQAHQRCSVTHHYSKLD